MDKSRVILAILSFFLSLAVPPTARAAGDICVSQARGLPYESKTKPEWWTAGLSQSRKEGTWTGATTRTSGQGAAPQLARSRMIWDKGSQTVFFELEVNGDPSFDPAEDFVMLALSDSTGQKPQLGIQFFPLHDYDDPQVGKGIDGPMKTDDGNGVDYWTIKGEDIMPGDTLPADGDFRVSHPWVVVDHVAENSYNWKLSFALKVPVDAVGEIRPNLRVYGNVNMYNGAGQAQFPLLCNSSKSAMNGMDCLMLSGDTYLLKVPGLADSATMASLWPVLGSNDSNDCGGVKVIRELVGSDYGSPSGTNNGTVPGTAVQYPLPSTQIPRTTGARLRAGFHNGTSTVLATGDIEAEFYVANWGAQYASFDDSATWQKLFAGPIPLQGKVSPGRYAGEIGQGRIESPDKWVPKDAGLALAPSHQCMFVRLQSTKPGIDFTVDSVYRNMDLVTASVARRPATIDLGNRPLPKGRGKHEVYLLVRTQHMPDPARCAAAKGKLYGCAKGGRLLRERRALSKAHRQALKADFAAGRIDLDQAQVDALLEQKDRKGVKTEELPFVVVYAMVDTGHRVDLPGKPSTPVLQHFSEFGYYVEHEGDLEGWETLMHGAEPVPGTNNMFKLEIEPKKVASVANTMRVLSKETKACKTRPHPRLGVVSQQRAEELESKLLADVGKGDVAAMSKARMADDQLGCDPPPLRMQCRRKDCGEHSPAAVIDGSRYVGDWKGLERRRIGPSKQPDATPPAAKPAAAPKAGG